jgi:CubicO group peptidase (beta-lactamase class C family)
MRAVFLLPLAAVLLHAQSDLAARLDQIATSELARQHLPGIAVAAVRDGQIVYAKGFGVASVESKAPVTADTLFRAGQSTKMFVALAAVMLSEQGRLRLDRPVGDYIVGLNPSLATITAHNILSQTTGLKDDSPNYGPHDEAALARETASWNQSAVLTEPGHTFSSSNLGFALAGRLLEVIKGAHFADVMDDLIFRPWGITHSTFRPTVAMTYPLAAGHTADGKVLRPAPDNSAYWPAMSLYSSASDLSRFMTIFLNNGRLGDNELASPELLAAMAESKTPRPGLPGTAYGYGLIVDSTHTIRLLRQAVAVPGYDGALVMAPEFKAGVVVLVNQAGGDATAIADRLLERVSPVGLGPPSEQPAPSGGDLSRYAGKYVNGSAGYEFALSGGKLTLKTSGDPAPLDPTTGDCFRGGGITVCFQDGFAHVGVRAYKRP